MNAVGPKGEAEKDTVPSKNRAIAPRAAKEVVETVLDGRTICLLATNDDCSAAVVIGKKERFGLSSRANGKSAGESKHCLFVPGLQTDGGYGQRSPNLPICVLDSRPRKGEDHRMTP